MRSKTLKIGCVLFLISCASACRRLENGSTVSSQAQPVTSQSRADARDIELESVQFFNQAEVTHLRIQRDSRSTNPERFDVIAVVKNTGRSSVQHGEFVIVTTLNFIVAPDAPIGEAGKIVSEYTWSRDGLVNDLKVAIVPFTEPQKEQRITFKGFDLSASNKILNEPDAIERVWAIKATVYVLDRNMNVVAQKDAIIAIG